MQVEFRESFAYEAWVVSSRFGTPASYRIYLRVLDPGRANWFANKHLGDLLAKALFEAIMAGKFGDYQNARESDYVNHLEVDFGGIPCVISAGQARGIASKMLIGVRRVSTLNSRNQVSFEVNHCAGAVEG